ncbi:ABC transporter permease subunit [Metabacillus fastidiosus]|uniref:ABC transporter permease subunit n=1 Tax=Metabacillus fastidiosus TaxID=1458 RepID=UPI003D2A6D14
MNSFTVLLKKECIQLIREMKIIWLPLVFIFLGMTQPVMSYYLPTILEALGGGQGITIDPSFTQQSGGEVLASTLGSQFDQLGIMIIVISIMGIIQSDKASGMLAFIMTRPVPVYSYTIGKIISNYVFIACSIGLGYIVSYFYVLYLFTNVNFGQAVLALFSYLLWVLFIITFTAMMSTILNSQAAIALISIIFLLACRMLVGLNPIIDSVNPAAMSKAAMELLIAGTVDIKVVVSTIVTIILIGLTIFITNYWISSKKYSSE